MVAALHWALEVDSEALFLMSVPCLVGEDGRTEIADKASLLDVVLQDTVDLLSALEGGIAAGALLYPTDAWLAEQLVAASSRDPGLGHEPQADGADELFIVRLDSIVCAHLHVFPQMRWHYSALD